LLTGIPEAIGTYFNERQKLKAAAAMRKMEFEDAIHKRKLDLISQGLTADMNWEMEFARQAETSWKDEYTLIVISIPAVMAFIPFLAPYVKEGFAALQDTPLWYQTVLISLFLATVGIRWFRRTQSDT
jgi:hypothetical protein